MPAVVHPLPSLNTACSSPFKDEDSDPDAYMLEATQPFCKEPGLLSEEPTQAFAAEEEDAELFFQHPPEGGELTEKLTQPAFPILASRAQQTQHTYTTYIHNTDHRSEDSTQPYSIGLPSSPESIPLPAGSTTTEESEEKEEIKPVGSEPDPSADGSHPLALQEVEEVTGSPEQPCVAASDAESPAERSQAGEQEDFLGPWNALIIGQELPCVGCGLGERNTSNRACRADILQLQIMMGSMCTVCSVKHHIVFLQSGLTCFLEPAGTFLTLPLHNQCRSRRLPAGSS